VIPRPADQVPDEYGDDSINTFYLSDSLNHFEATHIGTSGRQGSTIPPHMPGSGSEYRIFTLGNHHAGKYAGNLIPICLFICVQVTTRVRENPTVFQVSM
jgi:hypothetical protein